MDKMWKIVKSNNLANKGLNIWVYEKNENVFSGVELIEEPGTEIKLEMKNIALYKYAYCKHIGPYNLIKQTKQVMTDNLERMGFETDLPYIEIYGYWRKNENELETELLMSLI
jgi:effector-binding domain-containing protein